MRLDHKLQFAETKEDEHPVNYAVPDFGLEKDIIDSQKHLEDAQRNALYQSNLQLNVEREPLLIKEEPVK